MCNECADNAMDIHKDEPAVEKDRNVKTEGSSYDRVLTTVLLVDSEGNQSVYLARFAVPQNYGFYMSGFVSIDGESVNDFITRHREADKPIRLIDETMTVSWHTAAVVRTAMADPYIRWVLA